MGKSPFFIQQGAIKWAEYLKYNKKTVQALIIQDAKTQIINAIRKTHLRIRY